MKTAIFEIDRGVSIWIWLCQACVNARRKAGWSVKSRKKPPHDLPCQDCPKVAS